MDIYRRDCVIECPYCHHEMNKGSSYDPESLPWNDGDAVERECDACSKKFSITAVVSIDHVMEEIDD